MLVFLVTYVCSLKFLAFSLWLVSLRAVIAGSRNSFDSFKERLIVHIQNTANPSVMKALNISKTNFGPILSGKINSSWVHTAVKLDTAILTIVIIIMIAIPRYMSPVYSRYLVGSFVSPPAEFYSLPSLLSTISTSSMSSTSWAFTFFPFALLFWAWLGC